MKLSIPVLLLLLSLLFLGGLSTQPNHETESDVPQRVQAVNLEQKYSFAGEELPLSKQDIYERLDRELLVNTFWHSSTILNLKRSKKYFPVIEKILREEGIPDDFKYLCVAESNLTNAVSPSGAKGFWQFLKSTAQSYGLEVNKYVDERFNLELATRAACQYLKKAKQDFGSWSLAALSYNMGSTGLHKQMSLQEARSIFDLNVNEESMRYLFRIVALKSILENPDKFGFMIEEDQYYRPLSEYNKVAVDSSIKSIPKFAAQYGASYRDIKYYNPWLISHTLPNMTKKSYQIKIPKKG